MSKGMLESIFCKIISDKQQVEKLNSLHDKNEIYKLFGENGYQKPYDKFEEEIKAFLNSEDGKNLINNNFDELSDDMLEMVAGGLTVKQATTAGIATLLTAVTFGVIGSQVLSQNKTDATPIASQSTSSFSENNDNRNNDDNNNEQAKDNKIDENKPDGSQKINNRRGPARSKTMNNRRGPNRPGVHGSSHNNGDPGSSHDNGGPGSSHDNGGSSSSHDNGGPGSSHDNGGSSSSHNNGGSNGTINNTQQNIMGINIQNIIDVDVNIDIEDTNGILSKIDQHRKNADMYLNLIKELREKRNVTISSTDDSANEEILLSRLMNHELNAANALTALNNHVTAKKDLPKNRTTKHIAIEKEIENDIDVYSNTVKYIKNYTVQLEKLHNNNLQAEKTISQKEDSLRISPITTYGSDEINQDAIDINLDIDTNNPDDILAKIDQHQKKADMYSKQLTELRKNKKITTSSTNDSALEESLLLRLIAHETIASNALTNLNKHLTAKKDLPKHKTQERITIEKEIKIDLSNYANALKNIQNYTTQLEELHNNNPQSEKIISQKEASIKNLQIKTNKNNEIDDEINQNIKNLQDLAKVQNKGAAFHNKLLQAKTTGEKDEIQTTIQRIQKTDAEITQCRLDIETLLQQMDEFNNQINSKEITLGTCNNKEQAQRIRIEQKDLKVARNKLLINGQNKADHLRKLLKEMNRLTKQLKNIAHQKYNSINKELNAIKSQMSKLDESALKLKDKMTNMDKELKANELSLKSCLEKDKEKLIQKGKLLENTKNSLNNQLVEALKQRNNLGEKYGNLQNQLSKILPIIQQNDMEEDYAEDDE